MLSLHIKEYYGIFRSGLYNTVSNGTIYLSYFIVPGVVHTQPVNYQCLNFIVFAQEFQEPFLLLIKSVLLKQRLAKLLKKY